MGLRRARACSMRSQQFMEHEPLPPSLPGTDALSLADLFAPRSGKPAQAAVQASSLDIPPALAARWSVEARQGGYLPDTLFAAAWLLLQSRWLGTPSVELHEALDTGASTRLALRCEQDSSAWQWIAEVDRARRD